MITDRLNSLVLTGPLAESGSGLSEWHSAKQTHQVLYFATHDRGVSDASQSDLKVIPLSRERDNISPYQVCLALSCRRGTTRNGSRSAELLCPRVKNFKQPQLSASLQVSVSGRPGRSQRTSDQGHSG